MHRRIFIKNTGFLAAGVGLTGASVLASQTNPKNKLPRWKGFNLTDFNTPNPSPNRRYTTEEQLKWMHDWGFDFVRLPISYPYYLDVDKSKKISPDEVYKINNKALDQIDN